MGGSPCAAANPAGASRLQSLRLVGRVAELGSLGGFATLERSATLTNWTTIRTDTANVNPMTFTDTAATNRMNFYRVRRLANP